MIRTVRLAVAVGLALLLIAATQKPPLHGRHWVAVTGKPLAATAGAMIFQRGGNAVDAACAMLAATTTMWDTLSWGGETQALIYNPKTGKVIGINALGVAPTGATPDFFQHPPELLHVGRPVATVPTGSPDRVGYPIPPFPHAYGRHRKAKFLGDLPDTRCVGRRTRPLKGFLGHRSLSRARSCALIALSGLPWSQRFPLESRR